MRVLLTVLLAVSSVNAYDAVVFSNERKITEDFPSIENLLSTASATSPLIFIVNPDFTLGQFSREAHAYSADKNVTGLPAVVKSAKYHASRYLTKPIYAPGAVTVTSMADFSSSEEVYIVAGEDWFTMETLVGDVIFKLGNEYTGVITATEAVTLNKTRVKRVATSEMEDDAPQAAGPDMDMPMVLPPYNRSQYPDVKPGVQALGSCMLYLEGVNIIVQNSKKVFATIPIRSLTNTTSWNYADGDVKCSNATNGTYTFSVRLKLKGEVSDSAKRVKISGGNQLMFTLSFGGAGGAWRLMNITADNIAVEGTGAQFLSGKVTAQKNVISQPSVNNMGLNSVSGYAVGCSDSQAAFFKTDQENVLIGVSVYNIEVQSFGVFPDKKTQQMYFTRQVEDCVGTFSVGSWMGILSTIFMLSGFFFGFLMLNSVQTMDRFDDPKHKQIVINVRE